MIRDGTVRDFRQCQQTSTVVRARFDALPALVKQVQTSTQQMFFPFVDRSDVHEYHLKGLCSTPYLNLARIASHVSFSAFSFCFVLSRPLSTDVRARLSCSSVEPKTIHRRSASQTMFTWLKRKRERCSDALAGAKDFNWR